MSGPLNSFTSSRKIATFMARASGTNLSPYDRVAVYLSLCAVSNHIRRFKRPEYIAHRDFTPIEPVADDALLAYARAYKVAAE